MLVRNYYLFEMVDTNSFVVCSSTKIFVVEHVCWLVKLEMLHDLYFLTDLVNLDLCWRRDTHEEPSWLKSCYILCGKSDLSTIICNRLVWHYNVIDRIIYQASSISVINVWGWTDVTSVFDRHFWSCRIVPRQKMPSWDKCLTSAGQGRGRPEMQPYYRQRDTYVYRYNVGKLFLWLVKMNPTIWWEGLWRINRMFRTVLNGLQ